MRAISGWSTREEYRRFLSVQYAARLPIENWMTANAPDGLNAPAQSHLIGHDLSELGAPLPEPGAPFTLAREHRRDARHNASALGAAWVLAGSALGNRSILKELERAGHGNWPCGFLADPAMLAFWKRLRLRINEPADLETLTAASDAAIAVFDHFIAHTQIGAVTDAPAVLEAL